MRRQQIIRLLAATLLGGAAVTSMAPSIAVAEPAGPLTGNAVFTWKSTDPRNAQPGSVVSSEPATLPGTLGRLARAKKIRYVTTDVRGASITATGLVLTPKENKKNKTVVWAHGTTGIGDRCAPSGNDDVFWPEAQAAIAELLRRGWTVAAPDYPGLGTSLPHPYLVGNSEGRSIIDSVRAARHLDDDLSRQYVVDGHSQGAQGALFANQLAASYDGDLQLRGSVSIAPTSGVETLAELIPGSAGNGYLVMALFGLNAVEPSFRPTAVLAAPARQKLAVLQSGCLYEVLGAYASLTAEELLIGGKLPDAWVAKLSQYVEPGQTPQTAPVFVVQGIDDESVPVGLTDALVAKLRGQGASVRYDKLPGQNHDGAVFASTETVANWIAQRF